MKKCPYCAEKIKNEAIKCKHCGEILKQPDKPPKPFSKLKSKPKIILQHPFVIKTTAIIILSKDIIAVIFGFLIKDSSLISPGIILWDLFFVYHLLKMKNWARLWVIGRTILGMAYLTYLYILEVNYLGWVLDIGILSCILVLLFGKGSKKKAIIVTSSYIFLILFLIGVFSRGMVIQNKTENIIKQSSLLKEQKSDTGFKVMLPSENWRFLKKEDSLEILGEYVKDANICIVDISGNVYGVFSGEDITGLEIDMSEVLEYAKKEVVQEFKIVNELKEEKSVFIETQFIENSVDYVFLYSYLAYSNTGVTAMFYGELKKYNELREEIIKIISDIQEISRKEFTPVLSSQEIYKLNTDAVVLVRVYDVKSNLVGYSSGFNVREDGLIVTNLHSIIAGHYVDIKFPNHGAYEEVYIAGLSNTLHDLVILKIEGKNLPIVDLDDVMETEVGDKVVVISNPEGLLNSLSEGTISGLRNIEGYLYYQMTAPISQGSSGGAVFNQYGNIIGISTAILESGQNLNFSIPITELSNIEILEQYITLSQFQEFLETEKNKK